MHAPHARGDERRPIITGTCGTDYPESAPRAVRIRSIITCGDDATATREPTMRSYRSKPLISTLRSGQALLMDGAMGTELVKKGLPPGENPVAWNLQHPERVR